MNDIGREHPIQNTQRLAGIHAAKRFMSERKNIFTDRVTGLYNRAWFEDDLKRKTIEQKRTGSPIWGFILDFDDFKQYNTVFGYREGGDEILRLIGTIPRRREERICRIGGEEFAQLINEDVKDTDIEMIATRYLKHIRTISKEALKSLNPLPGHEKEAKHIENVTMSIGITKYVPGEDPEVFLRRANQALDRAKKTGKNKAVVANIRNDVISYEEIGENQAA